MPPTLAFPKGIAEDKTLEPGIEILDMFLKAQSLLDVVICPTFQLSSGKWR